MDTEMIMKAKRAKSADELVKIAEENGLSLSLADAGQLYQKIHQPSGELSDNELDTAVGGCGVREYFAKDTRFDVTDVIGEGLVEVKDASREKLGDMTVGLTRTLNKIAGEQKV